MVTGGGTGGHLFPAVSVAEGVRDNIPGSEIVFIGTNRHVDNIALQKLGFGREKLDFSGVKGLGFSGALKALWKLLPAVIKSIGIINRFKPDLVFGVGGYVTVPVVIAARIMRVPVCIHEQNSIPGLANRLTGKLAHRICLSLPCACSFSRKKTVLTGNPVRREILLASDAGKGKSDRITILVLGGSQGAHRINELMVEVASFASVFQKGGVKVIHQTGSRDEEMVKEGYKGAGVEAVVSDFFYDMAALYKKADLVVSRAGATTLAELAVMGLPALLIPFPFAADDHQRLNAEFYARGGGAKVILEQDVNGQKLAQTIDLLVRQKDALTEMGNCMRKLAKPEATKEIISVCLQLIND